MTDTPRIIDEIRASLEGVTVYDGPWEVGEVVHQRSRSAAFEIQNATDIFGYVYCGTNEEDEIRPVAQLIVACSPDRIRALLDHVAAQAEESERLRNVVSKSAAALGNGASVSPSCSVEFMEEVPKEVSLVVAAQSVRAEAAEARVRELEGENAELRKIKATKDELDAIARAVLTGEKQS